jgi:hypothetical protein
VPWLRRRTEQGSEAGRGRADDFHVFAAGGMGKTDFPGVQLIPEIAGKRGAAVIVQREARRSAGLVKRITDQREAGVSQMNADLMGTAGRDRHFQEGGIFQGKPADDPDMAGRRPAVGRKGMDTRPRIKDAVECGGI